jgi:hypothetical protein
MWYMTSYAKVLKVHLAHRVERSSAKQSCALKLRCAGFIAFPHASLMTMHAIRTCKDNYFPVNPTKFNRLGRRVLGAVPSLARAWHPPHTPSPQQQED